jgi:A/G-specific adenine glycosylase
VPYRITLARRLDLAGQSHVWVDAAKLGQAALPAPVKKLLLDLFGAGDAAQSRMSF